MHPHAFKLRLWTQLIVLFLKCAIIMATEATGKYQSCHLAQLQCHTRSGCQRALNNFFVHCHSVIKGEQVDTCPTDCKHALVSLLSTEDETGLAFMYCDCHEEDVCMERKERVKICQREVLESMHVLQEDSPPVTCNLARWICEADTSCLAALQYYFDHCSRLFSGLRCTSKCRNSLEILSRQPHASKLRSCTCDGSEDYDCRSVKLNTETLCFHRKRKLFPKSGTNSTQKLSGKMADSGNNSTTKELSGRERKRTRRRRKRNRVLNGLAKKKGKRQRRRGLRKRRARKKKRHSKNPSES